MLTEKYFNPWLENTSNNYLTEEDFRKTLFSFYEVLAPQIDTNEWDKRSNELNKCFYVLASGIVDACGSGLVSNRTITIQECMQAAWCNVEDFDIEDPNARVFNFFTEKMLENIRKMYQDRAKDKPLTTKQKKVLENINVK